MNFRNYLVIDKDHDDWCIAHFDSITKAIPFCYHITPYGTRFLEIWGTNEDIDIFMSATTVFKFDIETGKSEIIH